MGELVLLSQTNDFGRQDPPARTDLEHLNFAPLAHSVKGCRRKPAAFLLAAQMIGTQRAAIAFLVRATREGQTFEGTDANVLRATRLMRLFNEQAETMAKLKGKTGQQRVVVEHVTVASGGQAIVGTVIPGARGRMSTTLDDPMRTDTAG